MDLKNYWEVSSERRKNRETHPEEKEDALKKGQVAVSKDIQITVKLLSFYFLLFWLAKDYDIQFSELLDQIIATGFNGNHTLNGAVFFAALELLNVIVLPLLLVCAVMGSLSTWGQTGWVFQLKRFNPRLKNWMRYKP